MKAINDAIERLSHVHKQHIAYYDPRGGQVGQSIDLLFNQSTGQRASLDWRARDGVDHSVQQRCRLARMQHSYSTSVRRGEQGILGGASINRLINQ